MINSLFALAVPEQHFKSMSKKKLFRAPIWDAKHPDQNPGPSPNNVLGEAHNTVVAFRTPAGSIRIKLRSDWHGPSTEAVVALAQAGEDACSACEIYRVEPGFLVQGILKGDLPVNDKTGCKPAPECQPGPRTMIRGDVGWAGGGPGPDFFIYLGTEPAEWLRRDHTVWGEVADEESLELADRIVALPSSTPGGEGTMRFLDDRLKLDVLPTSP